ncbi:acetyl esterase/lipase [Mycolicibacterium sp. BK556]|uniref:alpha/beta hydrolase n=1 Tax=Mycobacteriaceae TaxID=1762 RepID=UPI00105DD221|nr:MULTISPECIES: alpha/beta hydrolase [Mycobacteriaceae]MBB3602335.1 acetyl esterase/lipase [Mycolicibacterium sp. BK556]MBB3632087.1 acetyl esterase/lipase [Mycolicibacterium sp. BK607]MBB3750108.1 acetyl esterase/lipase [Mycolicibacterium sp. BK634]TDO18624.1 acetyl esterase/lipase [Mycobacterium sp. BK086]
MKALPAALGAAAVALTALALRRYLSARDALAAVPAELRSPLLPALTGDTTERNYRRSRLLTRIVSTPTGAGVTVTKRQIAGRPVLVMTPATRGPAALLYIHGGGMVVGSPQSEAVAAAQLARELGALVVSPDYRLAPEHPFPAALNDCMATLYWMRDNAAELGIDPERISVNGSSAGGGLSASVAQRAHDEGIALRAQVLVYPMIDDRTTLRDDHNGRGAFLWTPGSNRFGWTAYLGRPPRWSDAPEYAAPNRREDLSGLAPAWVGVGGLDLFYDESVDYAERLRAAGVECELVAVPGMYHAADGLARRAPEMRAFRQSALEFLRSHL